MSGRSIPSKEKTAQSPPTKAGFSNVSVKTTEPTSPSAFGASAGKHSIELGVIVENSQGAMPSTPSKTLKGHGMMKRLTTEEWNEQKDLVTMARPKKIIH